jgi:hypothetical protein
MTKKTPVILHGEAMVFPSKLPEGLKQIKPSNHETGFHIVADSETTGNHHVVDTFDGVDLYEDEKGTLFMQNTRPTQLRCVIDERHSSQTLEAGTWEFGIQQEYDPIAQMLTKVRD